MSAIRAAHDKPTVIFSHNVGAGGRIDEISLEMKVNDSKVRSQVWGFDGRETAFAVFPRNTPDGVKWDDRVNLGWEYHTIGWKEQQDGIPSDSGIDIHRKLIDARGHDLDAIRKYGVAFGMYTNKGELWVQEPNQNSYPLDRNND